MPVDHSKWDEVGTYAVRELYEHVALAMLKACDAEIARLRAETSYATPKGHGGLSTRCPESLFIIPERSKVTQRRESARAVLMRDCQ